ncbi:MAG: zinc ribbon domain-containing protein [Clostridiales bacterium]|nr:zinc ribbon domain-containing protein [Clostridiales bacterium]
MCPKCKNVLRAGMKFCTYCGAPLAFQETEGQNSDNGNKKGDCLLLSSLLPQLRLRVLYGF